MKSSFSMREAQLKWGSVLKSASQGRVVLTRYRQSWVALTPLKGRAMEIIRSVPLARYTQRAAEKMICELAADIRANGKAVVIVTNWGRWVLMVPEARN